MAALRKIDMDIIGKCAEIYVKAYSKVPWDEEHRIEDVKAYIADFLDSDTRRAYVLLEEGTVVGMVLGLVIPSIGSHYFRVEDICVDPDRQRKGYGGRLLASLEEALKPEGCDSILLGTQKGYPSHRFYLKNRFIEIDSALLYREIKADGK